MAASHLSKEKVLLKVNSAVSIYDVKSFDGLGFCIIQGGPRTSNSEMPVRLKGEEGTQKSCKRAAGRVARSLAPLQALGMRRPVP